MTLPEWIKKLEEIKKSIEGRTKGKAELEIKVKDYAECYTYDEVKSIARTDIFLRELVEPFENIIKQLIKNNKLRAGAKMKANPKNLALLATLFDKLKNVENLKKANFEAQHQIMLYAFTYLSYAEFFKNLIQDFFEVSDERFFFLDAIRKIEFFEEFEKVEIFFDNELRKRIAHFDWEIKFGTPANMDNSFFSDITLEELMYKCNGLGFFVVMLLFRLKEKD